MRNGYCSTTVKTTDTTYLGARSSRAQRSLAVGLVAIEATLPTSTPRIFTLASGFMTRPARSEITVTGTVSVKDPRKRPIANAMTATSATMAARPASARWLSSWLSVAYPERLKLPLEP